MKKKLQISLPTINDMRSFANTVTSFESNVSIMKGHHICDAKSIMALFYLGTLDGVYIEIESDDEDEIKWFNHVMDKYVIKE